ncbi:uncharacterized protein C18orf63 homolog [Anomaloglossus baeobatrachus]|uniref:uncharacterized protein C18orf63 homolog n=1 Tax=Anomaloglossus baeobatrachus TaxID=238106 RepID=UPI003F4F4C81
MEESIVFWNLPDFENLCAVKLIMNSEISDPDIRNKQVKLSRCLLFLYDHIVASPIPEEFRHILVIMSISFYKTGNLQAVADKQQFTMEKPEIVTPAMLQSCLFYSITVRLAPYWNKAGNLLIQGADFLTKSGKQDAVAISINVLDNQLYIAVHVHTVRLPPCQLCDFDVDSECFQRSLTWNSSSIRQKSDSSNWCYVLPSMKMGRIVHLSHDIPPECPFKSYKDFQNYWNTLYGYELPHMSESDMLYCSVYFKFIGETIFTYPFICLRSQPIQFYPRVHLTKVMNTFVEDLKSKMPHLCGFPVNMTSTPFFPVKELSRPQLQGNNCLTNLTASMELTMIPQNSIPLNQSLACCSEKHPGTSMYVQHVTSYKVTLGSQCSDSSHPLCSNPSGNGQKIVPFFHGKTGKSKQNDMKIAEENKTVVSSISDELQIYDKSSSIVKDVLPRKASLLQSFDTKRNTPSNVLCKSLKMKSKKEVFTNTGLICPYPFSEKQSCFSVSITPENHKSDLNRNNSEPSQSQVFDSCKENYTSDIVAFISQNRKEDHKDIESVKISNNHFSSNQVKEENFQEENFVLPAKKYKISKTVKKMDVEQQARDDKLFKVNNAQLQDWLKQHGISTRTREKKEQLVAKIMQFIQQS